MGQDTSPPGNPDTASANVSDPDTTEPSHPRRWLRRVGLVALYSIALIGVGIVIGWFAVTRAAPTPLATEIVQVPIVPETGSDVTMPDVRGLDESTGRTALTDAGIPADAITVATRPAAGNVGVIVTQDPAYGTASPTTVVLTVSTEAAVPDVIGQSEDDATTELLALGARVEMKREYDPTVDAGLVLATTPKAGKPIVDGVTVTVAEAPASAYLTQLATLDGSNECNTTTAILAGQQYDQSLECSADTEPTDYTWLLAGKTTTFEATIGVPDDGDQSATANVDILVDGKRRATGTVSYTKPLPVTVDTKGGTQLTVRLTGPATDSPYTTIIIADGRLIGSNDQISELAGWAEQ